MFEIGKTKRDANYFEIGVLFLKLRSLYFSRTAFGRIFELLYILTNSALGFRYMYCEGTKIKNYKR